MRSRVARWPSSWAFAAAIAALLVTYAVRACALATRTTLAAHVLTLPQQRAAWLEAFMEEHRCRRSRE